MVKDNTLIPAGNNEPSNGELAGLISIDTPRKIGLTIFLIVFGVFGAWAAIAPLSGAAYAPGKVTVESYKKAVQHLEGGIVEEILVRNGDQVSSGDPLLVLEDTQPLAQLEIARAQQTSLLAREARLIAERDGLDEVFYPSSLSLSDSRVREEIAAQDGIFYARKSSLENNIEILEQRIEQLQTQVTGLKALRSSKEQLAASFAEELTDTKSLLERGFSDKTRLRGIERNYANYSGEVAELTSNIAAIEVQIGETRLQILREERDLHNEVVNQLSEVQTSLKDINERIIALQDIVTRTTIRAPESGIVNGMQIHTVGGVIAPGSAIAEIVPASDELVIEANVSPVDIDRVSIGQDTLMRFSTFGSSVPTINGRVTSLSADSMQDQNTGAMYYLVRIEVSDTGLESLGDLILVPGMPVEVFINTGSRTFLQYLFKPFSNAVARSLNED